MLKNWFAVLLVVGFCVGLISCQKLPPRPPVQTGPGPLALEKVKFQDAIPLEYGTFVGVTPNPESYQWAALWFEKPDKTITVLWVNIVEGRFGQDVTTIPRK